MYFALVRHGRHWKHKQAVAIDSDPNRPSELTPGEVDEIQQWIKTNDPNLREIEARANGPTR